MDCKKCKILPLGYVHGQGAKMELCHLHVAAREMLEALWLAKVTIRRLDEYESANGTLHIINAATAKAEGGK